MQYKDIAKVEYKVDKQKREVTGYAAIFNNIDRVDDKIVQGAFSNTLNQKFHGRIAAGKPPSIKALWQHRTDKPIGLPIHMEEDSKGLLTVTKLSETPTNDEYMTLISDGVVDSMSIGYDALQKEYIELERRNIRILKELRLWEYSFVTFPANELADVVSVKNLIFEIEEKRGRVLSAKNEEEIKGALDSLDNAVSRLRGVIELVASGDDPAKKKEVNRDSENIQSLFDIVERTRAIFQ